MRRGRTAESRRLVSPTGKRRTLAPVHPNRGVEAAYRRQLDKAIEAMHRSIVYWVAAQWRRNTPVMAQDDDAPGVSPAMGLRDELDALGSRWRSKFDDMAEDLARHFAKSATERADGALKAILDRGGWTVRFRMTRAANDALQATIGANISLIKSIASEHLTEAQGVVMRGVQTGRDLAQVTQDLEARYAITRRRAATIARDQTNKATATITRVRQQELGVTQAVWLHSGGGRHPRETHVKMNGKVYDVAKGMWDSAEQKFIWPGELINCRCVCKPIVEGFS